MHVSPNVLPYLETNKCFLEIAERQLYKVQRLPLFDSSPTDRKEHFSIHFPEELPWPVKYHQILLPFFPLFPLPLFFCLNRSNSQSDSCMLEDFLDAGNKLIELQSRIPSSPHRPQQFSSRRGGKVLDSPFIQRISINLQ